MGATQDLAMVVVVTDTDSLVPLVLAMAEASRPEVIGVKTVCLTKGSAHTTPTIYQHQE